MDADLLYRKDTNVTILSGNGTITVQKIGPNNSDLVVGVYLFSTHFLDLFFYIL